MALKIGLISSIGVWGEAASVAPLKGVLIDADVPTVVAAATALGAIGSPEAGSALAAAKPSSGTKGAIADAWLICAENLLAAGKKTAAKAAYERLLKGEPSQSVKVAAELGLKACEK